MQHPSTTRPRSSAFSLVELSIVLVILGLLVGGILSGQALIRAAELRSVTTQYQKYIAATNSFKDKYFSLPGDMPNAESFWGQLSPVNATCYNTASTSALTCNGDGDGNISVTGTRSREIFRYWQHLANAGLAEGQYSGTKASVSDWSAVPGTNSPLSKLAGGTWEVLTKYDVVPQGGFYLNIFQPNNSTNWLAFVSVPAPTSPILKPEEAWNIDAKLDDGLPGTGRITTFNNTQQSTCASSDVAASATYQLTQTVVACVLLMGF